MSLNEAWSEAMSEMNIHLKLGISYTLCSKWRTGYTYLSDASKIKYLIKLGWEVETIINCTPPKK